MKTLDSAAILTLVRRRSGLSQDELAARAGASNVRLFGSVARGEDTENSDIDFLVDFDLSSGLLPILRLNEELAELLGDRVEVAPVGVLKEKEEVLKRALEEAVPL